MVTVIRGHGSGPAFGILAYGRDEGYDRGQDCELGHPSHHRRSDDGHGRANSFFAPPRVLENDRPNYRC